VERIGETGDPCGMPFSTCLISPRLPSMQTAAWRSLRKDAVQRTYCSGIPLRLSSQSKRSWLTKSK
ncbi:hypothetical protein K438DRAFT_1590201, partial [Mycena galopus ATCC 62051]